MRKTASKTLKNTLTASLVVFLISCGGGGNDSPPVSVAPTPIPPIPPVSSVLKLNSDQEVVSFLSKMTFGASRGDIEGAINRDASELLSEEFAKPPSYILPFVMDYTDDNEGVQHRSYSAAFWNAMVDGDDQLRQRMVFALSQITVISDLNMGDRPRMNAHYVDTLYKHAFGNYKELLKEITYTPAMANFLTYYRNRDNSNQNPLQTPDENYAREFLQLFTVGVTELNIDGTQKLVNGMPVETYSNEDIVGLARVFTGLSCGGIDFWNCEDYDEIAPLVMYQNYHSKNEKQFLGKTIGAYVDGDAAIDQAIDHIFEHPNLAPFIASRLIQRFTASSPTPEYIERVATAFENGSYTSADNAQFGEGVRGDLKATLAAILLDEQFFNGEAKSNTDGKIREPVLRFIHWARAFDVGNVFAENEWALLFHARSNEGLGQQPFQAPSVFNFYRPGFIAPQSYSGNEGLTAPELQIIHEGSVIGYSDWMLEYVFNSSPTRDPSLDSFVPDYSYEVTLAEAPEQLAEHLDILLLGGLMKNKTKERITTILNEMPIRSDHEDNTADDRWNRVAVAVYMAVTSTEFSLAL
jgi:uncharacterized protein (DUF1800 family)